MEKEIKKRDFQEFIEYISEYEDKTAYRFLVDGEVKEKTYRELVDDSRQIASWFVNAGFNKAHIAILGSTSYEWIITFLGIALSGNVAVPLDKMLPPQELANLLNLGDVELMFMDPEFSTYKEMFSSNAPGLKNGISFRDELFLQIKKMPQTSLPKIEEDQLVQLLFTSGTTGTSKGVMLSHKNVISNVWGIRTWGINTDSPACMLSVLPIHHTFEITTELAVLLMGESICINDRMENIVKNMQRFQPLVMVVVPRIAEVFAKKIKEAVNEPGVKKRFEIGVKLCKILRKFGIHAERKVFSKIHEKFGGKLESVLVGGAPLRSDIIEILQSIGVQVYLAYGLTELAPSVSTNCPNFGNRIGSSGKLMPETSVRFVDGEIQIKSPSVTLGYYKDPMATQEAFEDGWFKSGDLGYMDEDGFLFITGRKKNVIILDNGENIYPEELEGYISEIECIKDSMVYAYDGKLCAMLQLFSATEERQAKEAIQRLNAKLPTHKKIHTIKFRSSDFPKTTTLKIKRKEVMQEIEAQEDKKTEYIAPRSEEEERICEVFERVLDKTQVGICHNFFEMGGDSLAALEAGAELGISAQEIYDHPTPEMLADRMQKETKTYEKKEEHINQIIEDTTSNIKAEKPKNVLLTGATGYLGAHILRELLQKKVEVVCLVRDPEKLRSILQYYFPKDYEKMKYTTVIGDIEDEMLGIREEEYENLCSRIDAVIHTAANVHHTGHYADFERINVVGTQNVIRFCEKSGAFLHHTSTASVSGAGTVKQTDPQAVFTENTLDVGQRYQENVYIHSKYKAEEKVILARKNGLRANIYRIGNLTWRAADGVFQKNADDNGFLHRCRGIMKVGAYCEEFDVFPVDFTAVDLCAKAYAELVLHGEINQIYHMVNPNMLYIHELGKYLRCKLVPRKEFERRMLEKMPDKDVAVLSFYVSVASVSANIELKTEVTSAKLQELGFCWPKVDLSYLKAMRRIS